MKNWFAQAKAGAILLGAVIVVQLALSGGYATALDSAVMNRLPVAVAGSPAAQALGHAFRSFPGTGITPLPAGDPHGSGPAMAVIAWALGGYLGAMLLGRVGGVRMRSFRQIGVRLIILLVIRPPREGRRRRR